MTTSVSLKSLAGGDVIIVPRGGMKSLRVTAYAVGRDAEPSAGALDKLLRELVAIRKDGRKS